MSQPIKVDTSVFGLVSEKQRFVISHGALLPLQVMAPHSKATLVLATIAANKYTVLVYSSTDLDSFLSVFLSVIINSQTRIKNVPRVCVCDCLTFFFLRKNVGIVKKRVPLAVNNLT